MPAVDVVVPATHGAEGATVVPASASTAAVVPASASTAAVVPASASTAAVVPASASTAAVVPASAIVCIAASACVPRILAYYGTFAVSLVHFARAAWPDRVDAVLAPLGAYARRAALLARADLDADLRLIRDAARAYPATESVCAGAEECARLARAAVAGWAGAARRRAEAKWSEHKDAAGAAWSLLRLAGRVVRLAATVLLEDLIDGTGQEVAAAGLAVNDVVSHVLIGFCLLVTGFIFRLNTITGMKVSTACLAATCVVLVLVDDWIDPPDDDADETDATGDGPDAADATTQDDAGGEETLVDAELEVRKSWEFVRVMTFAAYCVDAIYLHFMLGPRPVVLALLALYNFGVLDIGRRVELTPDDGEQAGAAGGVGAAVDKWRRGAIAVFLASSVKVLVFVVMYQYHMHGVYLGPPPSGLLLLGLMGDLLVSKEDYLLDLAYSDGDEEDGEDVGAADSSEDITGGVEEGADDEANAEPSNASSSEDHEEEANASSSEDHEEEANTSSSENEEESRALEEHRDISEDHFIPRDHEHPKEQQQEEEEPDSSSGGSVDDGWDLVEVDSEMRDEDVREANRKSSGLFAWNQAV